MKDPKLVDLIAEAENNFINDRHTNSAKVWRHIGEYSFERNFKIDAFYFYYRAVLSFEKEKNYQEMINTMIDTAKKFLTYAASLSTQQLESAKSEGDKLFFIKTAEKCMYYLRKDEERKSLLRSLFNHLVNKVEKLESISDKIKTYTDIIDVGNDIEHSNIITHVRELIKLYLDQAELEFEKKSYDYETIVILYKMQALQLIYDYNNQLNFDEKQKTELISEVRKDTGLKDQYQRYGVSWLNDPAKVKQFLNN